MATSRTSPDHAQFTRPRMTTGTVELNSSHKKDKRASFRLPISGTPEGVGQKESLVKALEFSASAMQPDFPAFAPRLCVAAGRTRACVSGLVGIRSMHVQLYKNRRPHKHFPSNLPLS